MELWKNTDVEEIGMKFQKKIIPVRRNPKILQEKQPGTHPNCYNHVKEN